MDVPGVDREHARISEVALIALGTDCAIGDVPLDSGSRRLVMPGDEIQIGSVVVALEGDDPSLLPPPLSEGEGTALRASCPKIRVVEGANFGDELALEEEGREYLVGRNASCDLVLEDREVSREHLRVARRGHQILIRDLSSTRGSWLGRSAVYTGSTVLWSRPSMLRVGASVLSLELPREFRTPGSAAKASAPLTAEPRKKSVSERPVASSEIPSSIPPASGPRPSSKRAFDARSAPSSSPIPLSMMSGAADAAAIDALSDIAVPGPKRTAWKKTGGMSKASGIFFLALAGIAVLAVIFGVFSLLE